MLSSVKSVVRQAIRSTGFDVHKLDSQKLGSQSLRHELPESIKTAFPIVVDVGANRGQRIELVRRAFRAPFVTSFEPNPSLAGLLRSKYGGAVFIVEAAVGNVEGEMDFHIYANDRLSSVRELDEQKAHLSDNDAKPRNTIKVPVVRLDKYWPKHRGTTEIDLLFIEAQGFDREVLEGAEGLLNEGKIGTIVTDVYCSQYYKDQHNYLGDLEPWLRQKGYGLVGLYEIMRDGPVISAAAACFRRIPDPKPGAMSEEYRIPVERGTRIAA